MNEQFLMFLFILVISVSGWKTSNLSASGALAAVLVGTAVAYALSWQGLIVLGVFFASSSFWSKYRKSEKNVIENKLAKTSIRDWQQVLANGGGSMVFSLFFLWTGDPIYIIAAVSALAAANADTWASEIGPLSSGKPVSVRTFKKTSKGTSGAVSALGTLASLGGALIVALAAWALFNEISATWMILVAAAGFLGSLIDTLLGAYLQIEYECKRCGQITEAPIHCDEKADKIKGIHMVNNEFVNFSASFLAGIAIIVVEKI
ncbi:DUF92 domain-containing protein [Bacillus sp. AK031]